MKRWFAAVLFTVYFLVLSLLAGFFLGRGMTPTGGWLLFVSFMVLAYVSAIRFGKDENEG